MHGIQGRNLEAGAKTETLEDHVPGLLPWLAWPAFYITQDHLPRGTLSAVDQDLLHHSASQTLSHRLAYRPIRWKLFISAVSLFRDDYRLQVVSS